jgi:hypothetical protein
MQIDMGIGQLEWLLTHWMKMRLPSQKIRIYPDARQWENIPANGGCGVVGVMIYSIEVAPLPVSEATYNGKYQY